MRHTRENAPIIKGFNDSVGRYWGFVLSLITRFNKRISSPRSPASWAACPSVYVTFIRRRFMKPPITDAQTNHNCWPGVLSWVAGSVPSACLWWCLHPRAGRGPLSFHTCPEPNHLMKGRLGIGGISLKKARVCLGHDSVRPGLLLAPL